MTLQIAAVGSISTAATLQVARVAAVGTVLSSTLRVDNVTAYGAASTAKTLRVARVSAAVASTATATLRVAAIAAASNATLRVASVTAAQQSAQPVIQPFTALTVNAFDTINVVPFSTGAAPDYYLFTVLAGNVTLTGNTPTPVANQRPTAAFTSTVSGPQATLDASTSADSDGTVTAYRWVFGDGTTGTGQRVSHTYSVSGTYSVTLTVTDDDGATGTVTHSVTATVAPVNVAPKAAFTPTVSGLTVSTNGSASSDPDGTIASYSWTWGEGTPTTGATSSHVYSKAGMFTVTLTVTDNSGATNSTSSIVTVSDPNAPVGVQQTGTGITRYQDVSGNAFNDHWTAVGSNLLSLASSTYGITDFQLANATGSSPAGYGAVTSASTGVLGAGPAFSKVEILPSTSTKTSAAAAATGTNGYYVLGSSHITNARYDGFNIIGTTQGHLYNGLRLQYCDAPKVSNMLIQNLPGNSSSPPGETFFINHFRGTTGTMDTIECDGSNGVPGDSTKWGSASMLATNTTTGFFTVKRLFGHEARYGKAFAGWESPDGGSFTDCWAVNTALGFGFEECGGTWTLDDCVFGGNIYDFHLAHSQSYNGGAPNRATIVIRNPQYTDNTGALHSYNGSSKKLTFYLPTNYTGAGTKAANAQSTADIQILFGSATAGWTDKTSTYLNATASWLLNSDTSYKGTPLTGYAKPAWAFTA